MPAVTEYTHGKQTLVLADGWDVSSFLTDSATPSEHGEFDTTTYGPGWDSTFQRDDPSGTVSLKGFWRDTVLEPIETVLDAAGVISIGPTGGATGTPARLAAVTLTKGDTPASDDALLPLNADYRATSGIGRGRWLRGKASASTGGTGTTQDFATELTRAAWMASLHDLSAALHGALVVTVQHSVDQAVWSTLGTFTSTTAAHKGYLISGTGPVHRYVRIIFTLASGTAIFAVAFSRRKLTH